MGPGGSSRGSRPASGENDQGGISLLLPGRVIGNRAGQSVGIQGRAVK